MITFNNVCVKYDGNDEFSLNNINIHIGQGEFVFLTGSSGAGKSTMLKLILKEVSPTSGDIMVVDQDLNQMRPKDVPFYRRKIGVVFQDYRLLENKTVYENVAFAMEAVQADPKLIARRVPKILNTVGLRNKAKKYPNQLSGGEQQRVALARSIANNPKLLICDEPTGNLDPLTSGGIMNLISDINKLGTTVLIATHDFTAVNKLQKRVINLKDGQVTFDRVGGY